MCSFPNRIKLIINFLKSICMFCSTMPGTKKLSVPRTSSSFRWNAPEVLLLCSQGAIYIASKDDPAPEYNYLEDDNVNFCTLLS